MILSSDAEAAAGDGAELAGALLEPDGSVLLTGRDPALELRLPLSPGRLAAIRIELLPHETHGGSIVRGGGGGRRTSTDSGGGLGIAALIAAAIGAGLYFSS